jgi:hypothetical protein
VRVQSRHRLRVSAAHADSVQTARFIEALTPPTIILVHGEKNEMRRLYNVSLAVSVCVCVCVCVCFSSISRCSNAAVKALARKYESNRSFGVHMPMNGELVTIEFEESRVVKAIGVLVRACLRFPQRMQRRCSCRYDCRPRLRASLAFV